jgi:hypothetical protein
MRLKESEFETEMSEVPSGLEHFEDRTPLKK